jgi:threonine aldolase
MREAMASAALGDDVYGEDPTINRLQDAAAERLGKEAGLFVSSGTMGNLIGILVSARSGEEIIADADSHTFLAEAGGAAALGGIQIMPVGTGAGIMTPEQVGEAIRVEDEHHPRTAAVTFEDTHNYHGGIAWPLEALRAASDEAHRNGLAVHLDGARMFNAAIATRTDVRDIAACADTVTFCLSKGLAAPVGSVLVGPAARIAEARRWRKMLGGGMRQVGMLGAAGLFALENMVDRLAEDHANALTLAEGLAEMDGIRLDLTRVQTNLVIFELERLSQATFLEECERRGLLGVAIGRHKVRFVTRYGIDSNDVQQALKVVADVLTAG